MIMEQIEEDVQTFGMKGKWVNDECMCGSMNE